ncbi:MAG: hypothetical protein HQ526_05040, partial [Actinobacteria bacterium]|nr:hypothetical protein [Actinomycetota bacterium]
FRRFTAPAADVAAGLRAIVATDPRAVFVVHSHYDHLPDITAVAKQTNATIFGTESTLNVARGGTVPADQLKLLAAGETHVIGEFTVTAIASPHSVVPSHNEPATPTIPEPLELPASSKALAEGGNFDFVVK